MPTNEVGTSAPRGRQVVPAEEAEAKLSEIARTPITLPKGARVTRGPETCPACGSRNVIWGCDSSQRKDREEIHPLVWDEEAWMADSFVCRDCDAGWIEPDEASAITWVRPYWVIP
jgi:hypothetical protein